MNDLKKESIKIIKSISAQFLFVHFFLVSIPFNFKGGEENNLREPKNMQSLGQC